MKHTRQSRTFIGAMALVAAGSAACAGWTNHTLHLPYAITILALAAVTSKMKVKLPGVNGNMSVNLPFLLMAVVCLSALEAIVIAAVSTAVQCWPKTDGKFRPEQMLFNVSMVAFSTSLASLTWHSAWLGKAAWISEPIMIVAATSTFFLGQTAPVAGIIKLTEGAVMRQVWLRIAQLSFPYFVLSAGMTSMVNAVSHHLGWAPALAIFPMLYAIHRSYRRYFINAEAAPLAPLSRAAAAGH